MIRGTADWRYEPRSRCWYVALSERADPPYRQQKVVEAVLDLDKDGRLAGIEIIGGPKLLIEPPLRAVSEQGSSDA